ncbi:DUF5994 family protein [Pseudonocardia artemisiae]|uniref:DUF5994 family protein n=1 Tax=Pseudonocardia bannensis TaxID=630973 RepID=UPI0034D98696
MSGRDSADCFAFFVAADTGYVDGAWWPRSRDLPVELRGHHFRRPPWLSLDVRRRGAGTEDVRGRSSRRCSPDHTIRWPAANRGPRTCTPGCEPSPWRRPRSRRCTESVGVVSPTASRGEIDGSRRCGRRHWMGTASLPR